MIRLDAKAQNANQTLEASPKPLHQGSAEIASVSPSVAKAFKRGRLPPYPRTCAICGTDFESMSMCGKYCSEPCKIEGNRRRTAEIAEQKRIEAEKLEQRRMKLVD